MSLLHRMHQECLNLIRSHRLPMSPATIEFTDSTYYWGQWHSSTRTLRFSQRLLTTKNWSWILGVLKHEMAHQYVTEVLKSEDGHGPDFQKACEMLGVPFEFRSARVDLVDLSLDWKMHLSVENPLMQKIEKLLNLAQSTNLHEAELAMAKAQKLNAENYLLPKQNLEFVTLILERKRKSITFTEKQILNILQKHFFVQCLIGLEYDLEQQRDFKTLEICGSPDHVQMAEYVYYFLKNTLKNLSANKQPNLRSYQRGVLDGFLKKLDEQSQVQENSTSVSRALALFKEDSHLRNYFRKLHPQLRSVSSTTGTLDSQSYSDGHSTGEKLILRKPLNAAQGFLGGFLTSSKSRSS